MMGGNLLNRMVLNVGRVIILSMILVFLMDMGFYLYRVFSLNARVEAIMVGVQRAVMDNNTLPADIESTYRKIFVNMAKDYNRGENFIDGLGWNYGGDMSGGMSDVLNMRGRRQVYTGSGWVEQDVEIVHKDMKKVGDYGDIMAVQFWVRVRQPLWGFGNSGGTDETRVIDKNTWSNTDHNAKNWNRSIARMTELVYTYYVPCLRYRSVTQ